MVLDRSHQLAIRVIHDSIGQRPIYFSASGGMINDLGLARWGVRHGLATKLELRSLERDNGGLVQGSPEFGGDWFDLEHSLKLYDDVYTYRGLRDREIWNDRASLNIPMQFYAMTALLADAARAADEDAETVERLRTDAAAFRVVGQGGSRGTS
jgi:hypothetical protein